MNTQTELSKQMHDQVDRIDGTPITLDDVVGTAGKIRRRRRLATGTAVLAAAAVIVPTGLFAGGLFDDGAAPGPATPTVAEDAVIDADAEVGPPPKLAYTDAERLVLPSGETVDVGHVYDGTARSGDELVGIRDQSGGEPWIDVFDTDGTVIDSLRVMGGPAASPDNTLVGWIHADGMVAARFDGTTSELGRVEGNYPQVVAALATGNCDEDETSCRIFVNPQEQGSPVTVDFAGTVEQVAGDFSQVAAVSSDGLIAGRTSPLDGDMTEPVCSSVYDEAAGDQLFATCELAFSYGAGFSPDDELLVGSHADSDGAGHRSLTVVDARTGDTVSQIDLAKTIERTTTISGATWEDDEHLLVRTATPSEAAGHLYNLYRVGIDGTVERLLEPDYENGAMTQPWLLIR